MSIFGLSSKFSFDASFRDIPVNKLIIATLQRSLSFSQKLPVPGWRNWAVSVFTQVVPNGFHGLNLLLHGHFFKLEGV